MPECDSGRGHSSINSQFDERKVLATHRFGEPCPSGHFAKLRPGKRNARSPLQATKDWQENESAPDASKNAAEESKVSGNNLPKTCPTWDTFWVSLRTVK